MKLESSEYLSSDAFYNREDFFYFQEKSRGEALTSTEVENVLALMPAGRPLRVLDTPCGFGRHSIELASRGHFVTGLDKSGLFLDEAEKRDSGNKVRFVRKELDTIIELGAFDLIVNLFNSFGYFNHRRNFRFLARCRNQLRDGGVLVIDTINGSRLRESGFLDPVVLRRDENTLSITKVVKRDSSPGINVEYTMASNLRGRCCHTNFSIRFYCSCLLESMLLRSGFSAVQFYRALTDMTPIAGDSKYMVLAATK